MHHFTRFASVESALARYALIAIHVPLILLAVLIAMVGGTAQHGSNLFAIVLNGLRATIEGLFNQWLSALELAGREVLMVAKGPLKPIKTDQTPFLQRGEESL